MITEDYTVHSKTETRDEITAVELVKDNRYQRRVLGIPVSAADFPDTITVEGVHAEGMSLGGKYRLTLAKIDD